MFFLDSAQWRNKTTLLFSTLSIDENRGKKMENLNFNLFFPSSRISEMKNAAAYLVTEVMDFLVQVVGFLLQLVQ